MSLRGTEGVTVTDDETGRQVIVCWIGGARPWGYGCADRKGCPGIVLGYATRRQGTKGAEAHLKWHADGEPTCVDCGAWLSRKGSTRCRKGTCEKDR